MYGTSPYAKITILISVVDPGSSGSVNDWPSESGSVNFEIGIQSEEISEKSSLFYHFI